MHYLSVGNPHCYRKADRQRPWFANVWCSVIGDQLIVPYFIDGKLNGDKYHKFLEKELPTLLEDLNLK